MKEFTFSPSNRDILAQLRKMPIFDAMEAEQLPHLLKLAKLRRYEADEIIISEGDTDQQVYFLVKGSCTVNVEGLDVGTISKVGDVFGEMGMVDHAPRSATITADSPTICMVLDGSFLEKMENVDKVAAKALFYRIFSEILAARIRDANRKVLQLEDQLEDLSVQLPTN